jgi:sulfatase maturation enzyme AslB (radical SAM superfamily)
MPQATLETYIRRLFESHHTPNVTVACQCGEPTLMKRDFFRRSVELVHKYAITSSNRVIDWTTLMRSTWRSPSPRPNSASSETTSVVHLPSKAGGAK